MLSGSAPPRPLGFAERAFGVMRDMTFRGTIYVERGDDDEEIELVVTGEYCRADRSVGQRAGFELEEVFRDGKRWEGELTDAEEDRARVVLQEALEARYDL